MAGRESVSPEQHAGNIRLFDHRSRTGRRFLAIGFREIDGAVPSALQMIGVLSDFRAEGKL